MRGEGRGMEGPPSLPGRRAGSPTLSPPHPAHGPAAGGCGKVAGGHLRGVKGPWMPLTYCAHHVSVCPSHGCPSHLLVPLLYMEW